MGVKEWRVFRNMYKGHIDKTKWGQDQGWEVGMAGVKGSGGGKMETTILEQQWKNVGKKSKWGFLPLAVTVSVIVDQPSHWEQIEHDIGNSLQTLNKQCWTMRYERRKNSKGSSLPSAGIMPRGMSQSTFKERGSKQSTVASGSYFILIISYLL